MKHIWEGRGKRDASSLLRMMIFCAVAAAGADHAGIVYTTQETTTGEIISGLMLIHWVLEADEMMGHVEYL